MNRLTQEQVKKALIYVPETGMFYWRHRDDRPRSWNAKHAGREAGSDCNGYVQIRVGGRDTYAHLLAWVYMTGAYPAPGMEIDHRNRRRGDNAWRNLREATKGQNGQNRGQRSTNTSGHKGVSWDASRGRWMASIGAGRRQIKLGRFDNIADAIAARRAAENEFHGEFAANATARTPGFPPTWLCHVIRNCSVSDRKAA